MKAPWSSNKGLECFKKKLVHFWLTRLKNIKENEVAFSYCASHLLWWFCCGGNLWKMLWNATILFFLVWKLFGINKTKQVWLIQGSAFKRWEVDQLMLYPKTFLSQNIRHTCLITALVAWHTLLAVETCTYSEAWYILLAKINNARLFFWAKRIAEFDL